MPGTLYCPSDISTEGGIPVCSSSWEVVNNLPPFDPSQLDPTILAQAFGAGFTLVAFFMVGSMGIRAFLNFIKQSWGFTHVQKVRCCCFCRYRFCCICTICFCCRRRCLGLLGFVRWH